VHYNDPHFPYAPPEGFTDRIQGEECRRLQAAVASGETPRGWMDANWDGSAERALAECRALYDAEIAYVDREIGRLLDGLSRSGRLAHALVIFTSDHGENQGEADLFYEHGPSLHDASLRVPLAFSGRGVAPGRDDSPASLEDLTPTVLAWVGVPSAERPPADGVDLSARLRGGSAPEAERVLVFAESGRAFHQHDFHRLVTGHGVHACVNGPRFSACQRGGEAIGLFDPRADPRLENDLTARHPEEAAEMRAALERWRGSAARERCVRTARWKLVERPRLDGGGERRLIDLAGDPEEAEDASERHPEERARLDAELDRRLAGLPERPLPALSGEQLDLLRALGYAD
jgi:arylsulfatase A-like enzyme